MNKKNAVSAARSAPLSRECPGCGFIDWAQRGMLSAGDMRRFCDRIEHRRLRKIASTCIAPVQRWARFT